MNDIGPDTNMRRLKRVPAEGGHAFTLETEKEQAKNNLLCNYCAFQRATKDYPECEIHSGMEALKARGALPLIRVCKSYQPVLTFRPKLIGLDGVFNTIRVGQAWSNRLAEGVTVGLVNAESGEVFGKAVVTKVQVGGFDDIINKHAYLNHTLLGMEPDEAAVRLKDIIYRAYGKLVVSNATHASVIYLRNLKHAVDTEG